MNDILPINVPFEFLTEPLAALTFSHEDLRIIHLKAGLVRKSALLDHYAEQLGLPRWLHRNWDAFRDNLLDFSWLNPIPRQLTIVHEDLPLKVGQRDRSIYLSLLGECVVRSRVPVVRVVFPQALEAKIRQLWRDLT